MADGYLNFDTKIDNTDFKAGLKSMGSSVQSLKSVLKSLKGSVKSALNIDTSSTSSKMMSLEEQLRKAEVELENATKKKEEFGKTKIPTEEYAAAEKEASKLEQELLKLLDKKEKFEDTGGNKNSRTYQQMEYDIDTVDKKLEAAEAEMCRLNEEGKKFKMGGDGAQFQKLSQNVDNAQGKVNVLKQKMGELSAKESEAGQSSGKVSSMLSNMGGATKKLGSKLLGATKNVGAMGLAFTKKLNPVPGLLNKVSGKVGGLGKKIGGMLKRVFIFSMMTKALRSLRSAFQSVISSDSDMANSFAQIKGNLLTAFAPIYSFVLPGIKAVLSALVTFTNFLANAMSSIFGKTIEQSTAVAKSLYKNTKATDSNTKSSKKNAKAKKQQLASFDELNVIQDDNTDNTDSSSSGSAPSFNATAMDIPIIDKIKDMIKSGDWEGIGKLLATKLNNALKKIPWSKIQKTSADIASKLARLLNGFFSVMDLADTLGNTVAQALNTGLIFAYTFLTTFDFKQFGTFIGRSINSFIKNFNWSILGKTIGGAIQGAISTAYGFVTTYDWGSLASGLATTINDMFASIDWVQAAQTLGMAIIGIFTEISTFLAEVDWQQIGIDIGNFLANIDWIGIVVSVITAIVNAIKATFNLIFGVLKALWTNIDNLLKEKCNGFREFLITFASVVKTIIKPVVNFIIGQVKNAWEGIKGILNSFYSTFKGIVSGVRQIFTGFIEFISGVFTGDWEKAWNGIKTIFKGVWDSLYAIVKLPINLIIDGINILWRGIYNAVKGIVDSLGGVAGAIGDLLGKDWHFKMPKNPPTIPKLATGAVIPPNKEFMAILGDQKRGVNIESPLSTIVDAFRQVQSENGTGISNSDLLNAISNMQVNVIVQQDSRGVFNMVKQEVVNEQRRTGKPAWT